MRFPILFIGALSFALGVWIFLYFIFAHPDGAVSGGIEVATAFAMVAFGSWVIWRRYREWRDD
ncbi:MAG: hypothetical protein ACREN8_10585 [Candidatus Dormibacteraceae bacterium]